MTDFDKDIARARRAEILLADPLLIEAFDGLKAEYMRRWEECESRDQDKRERLWWAVRVVNEVRNNLDSIVNNGKLAKAEVDATAGVKPKRFGIV